MELWSFILRESWVIFFGIVFFVALIASYLSGKILRKFLSISEKKGHFFAKHFFSASIKPLRFLLWVIAASYSVTLIKERFLLEYIFDVLNPILRVLIVFSFVWFFLLLIGNLEKGFLSRKSYRSKSIDKTTVTAVSKLLKAVVAASSILILLQTFGFSISGLLALGGMGGLIIGLAAKDILSNFFGSLVIYLDKPFKVGDWIRVIGQQIEGTVEDVGWRGTRIRGFDKRPIYVPNAVFSTSAIENPSKMSNRRIKQIIGLRYQDHKILSKITSEIKKMLQSRDDIDHSKALFVNLINFAHSSLDIRIYTFTKTTDWMEYQQIQENIFLEAMKIVEANGAEFAPSQTIHIEKN